jgi:hypothetical protein
VSPIPALRQRAAQAARCREADIEISAGPNQVYFSFPIGTDDAALARARRAMVAGGAGGIIITRRTPQKPSPPLPRTRVDGDPGWGAPSRKPTLDQLRLRRSRVFQVIRWGALLVLGGLLLYDRLK